MHYKLMIADNKMKIELFNSSVHEISAFIRLLQFGYGYSLNLKDFINHLKSIGVKEFKALYDL
ncbi:MAG: hypothetical protein WBG43_07685 [Marinifilaceae bacterium]